MSVITFRKSEKHKTIFAYTILLGTCIITYIISHILVENGMPVRLFDWDSLALIVAGFLLVGFQQEAGLPELLHRRISARKRFLVPVIVGIGFGIADVIVIKGILQPEPYERLPSYLQPFPYSILLFSAGAIYTEVFHRLIPLTLFMYLIIRFVARKFQFPSFIFLAILTSLYEPLNQLPAEPVWFVGYSFVSGFAMNMIQAWYYRQSGFLAALTVRLGHYLIFHILLGIYVQYFELVS